MRAARARWRIENETFNTLKNQGYHFEHNYGHGNKNLCTIMGMLMMLAFLIDQIQRLCSKNYEKIKTKTGAWYAVFESIRHTFKTFVWTHWTQLYEFLIDPRTHPPDNFMGMKMIVEK